MKEQERPLQSEPFDVNVVAHVALRMRSTIFLRCTSWLLRLVASLLHVFAQRNKHLASLSDPSSPIIIL